MVGDGCAIVTCAWVLQVETKVPEDISDGGLVGHEPMDDDVYCAVLR